MQWIQLFLVACALGGLPALVVAQSQDPEQSGQMSTDDDFMPPGGGQQGRMMDDQQQQQAQPPLVQQQGEQLIQGQVIRTEDRDINNQEHRFVLLRTRQGQTVRVDLGLTDNLPRGLDVRQNQWVLVAGRYDRVGDRQAFVARTFANVFNLATRGGETGGQGGQQQYRGQQPSRGQQGQATIVGQVLDTNVQGQGLSQNNIGAWVRTRDGQEVLVDLGSRQNAQQLNLQPGQTIYIQGQRQQMGNRTVVQAQEIGQLSQVQRIQRQGGQSGQQGQQMQQGDQQGPQYGERDGEQNWAQPRQQQQYRIQRQQREQQLQQRMQQQQRERQQEQAGQEEEI